jgi:hypothetical protein
MEAGSRELGAWCFEYSMHGAAAIVPSPSGRGLGEGMDRDSDW